MSNITEALLQHPCLVWLESLWSVWPQCCIETPFKLKPNKKYQKIIYRIQLIYIYTTHTTHTLTVYRGIAWKCSCSKTVRKPRTPKQKTILHHARKLHNQDHWNHWACLLARKGANEAEAVSFDRRAGKHIENAGTALLAHLMNIWYGTC